MRADSALFANPLAKAGVEFCNREFRIATIIESQWRSGASHFTPRGSVGTREHAAERAGPFRWKARPSRDSGCISARAKTPVSYSCMKVTCPRALPPSSELATTAPASSSTRWRTSDAARFTARWEPATCRWRAGNFRASRCRIAAARSSRFHTFAPPRPGSCSKPPASMSSQAPPGLALDGALEGLDATAVLPPLLRPNLLTDLEGYGAWERRAAWKPGG